jgi:uncharacterized protein YkwD
MAGECVSGGHIPAAPPWQAAAMQTSHPYGRAALAAAAALVLLAGCGQREVNAPPPLGHRHAADSPVAGAEPDTRSMGAAALGGSCGLRTEEALQRVNAARAAGRRCGSRTMPPAPPLRWDTQLFSAAEGHSSDMARRNYFEHRSPEGVHVSQRVSASRYNWKSVGENLAGGDRNIGEAVQGWLNSPDHCENLMDAKYVDVAVACVAQPGTEWGTYWTMVLGRK